MKNFKFYFAALFLSMIFLSCDKKEKVHKIDISKGWVIQTGDDENWASPELDDSHWIPIETGKFWEQQMFPDYDGIAWYRLKVIIPSSLKENSYGNAGISVSLGKIDDHEISYLNGTEIGRTEGYQQQRVYFLPDELIRWDKENVIAIRVQDFSGNGGMFAGTLQIKSTLIEDIISMEYSEPLIFMDDESLNQPVERNIKLKTKSANSSTGTLTIDIMDVVSNRKLSSESQDVTINERDSTFCKFVFKSQQKSIYKANMTFTDKESGDNFSISTLIAFYPQSHPEPVQKEPIVKYSVPDKMSPFAFENVNMEGYLQEWMMLNLSNRLLEVDETELLRCFYNRPGKQQWIGEHIGKFLHAASNTWQYTNDQKLKTKMERMVDILIYCQDDDGYLGTYTVSEQWRGWDVWVHKYNMIGLLSYYKATGYEPAFKACIRIGDLLCKTFGTKEGQLDIIEAGTHVGMAASSVIDPMSELYLYTNNSKYLDFCKYIVQAYDNSSGPKIITSMMETGKVDLTADGKAYEMLSNLVGLVRLYKITNDQTLSSAVNTAWNDIAAHKLYITGTSSSMERFLEDGVLPADDASHMGEGCVTTTWLQFNQMLFELTGEEKYMNEIEKTVYNHLLGAENPQTGCVAYYTPLEDAKPYSCEISCCMSSIPRGISLIPELCYTKLNGKGLAFNLYASGKVSELIENKEGKSVRTEMLVESSLFDEGKVKITLNPQKEHRFAFLLRVPEWAENFKVTTGGKEIKGNAGTYLELDEVWKSGTVIDICFDMKTTILAGGLSYPNHIAIKYGPQVLSFDQSLNPAIKDVDKILVDGTQLNLRKKENASFPQKWFGKELYEINARINNKPQTIILVPYAESGQNADKIKTWFKSI